MPGFAKVICLYLSISCITSVSSQSTKIEFIKQFVRETEREISQEALSNPVVQGFYQRSLNQFEALKPQLTNLNSSQADNIFAQAVNAKAMILLWNLEYNLVSLSFQQVSGNFELSKLFRDELRNGISAGMSENDLLIRLQKKYQKIESDSLSYYINNRKEAINNFHAKCDELKRDRKVYESRFNGSLLQVPPMMHFHNLLNDASNYMMHFQKEPGEGYNFVVRPGENIPGTEIQSMGVVFDYIPEIDFDQIAPLNENELTVLDSTGQNVPNLLLDTKYSVMLKIGHIPPGHPPIIEVFVTISIGDREFLKKLISNDDTYYSLQSFVLVSDEAEEALLEEKWYPGDQTQLRVSFADTTTIKLGIVQPQIQLELLEFRTLDEQPIDMVLPGDTIRLLARFSKKPKEELLNVTLKIADEAGENSPTHEITLMETPDKLIFQSDAFILSDSSSQDTDEEFHTLLTAPGGSLKAKADRESIELPIIEFDFDLTKDYPKTDATVQNLAISSIGSIPYSPLRYAIKFWDEKTRSMEKQLDFDGQLGAVSLEFSTWEEMQNYRIIVDEKPIEDDSIAFGKYDALVYLRRGDKLSAISDTLKFHFWKPNDALWLAKESNTIRKSPVHKEKLEVIRSIQDARDFTLSSDGQRLFICADSSVYLYDLEGQEKWILSSTDEPIMYPHDVNVDSTGKVLFWVEDASIIKYSLRSDSKPHKLITKNYGPSSLQVDRKNELLYWINPSGKQIMKNNFKGADESVLFEGYARSILVPDNEAYIFYSDDSYIYKIDLTTKQREIIIPKRDAPTLLAWDKELNRIYWKSLSDQKVRWAWKEDDYEVHLASFVSDENLFLTHDRVVNDLLIIPSNLAYKLNEDDEFDIWTMIRVYEDF